MISTLDWNREKLGMNRAETANGATEFVILGAQRTGTTLIRMSLSSHPDILCHGEVFNLGKKPYRDQGGYWHYSRLDYRHRIRSALRPIRATDLFLRRMYASPEHTAIGFKLMLSHCRLRPWIWHFLKKRKVKVLLVERRNVLKTLVSRRAASRSGVYHVSDSFRRGSSVKKWTPQKIHLDTGQLVGHLDSISRENGKWRERIGSELQYLNIVYEDHIADVAAGNETMLNFLGVRQAPLSADLKKVNPDRLEEIIGNYAEVAAALKGTPYAAYLDET